MKARTMIFIVPEKELPYLEDYKQLLPQAWTISPVKVITWKEAAQYPEASEQYTYFVLHLWEKLESRGGYSEYVYMGLDVPFKVPGNNKNRVKTQTIGWIDMNHEWNPSRGVPLKERLYTQCVLRNFSLPYMLAYARFIQEETLGKKTHLADHLEDKTLLAQLRKSTLYVTDSSFYHVKIFSAGRSAVKQTVDDMFSEYPGKYALTSSADLIRLLKEKKNDPVFLFEFVKVAGSKFMRVLELRSLQTAYRANAPMSQNLKPKDLKLILR
nr:hypothetical protein [uncultured Chitinophaga sp.]